MTASESFPTRSDEPLYSTRTCRHCGQSMRRRSRGWRTWECPACGWKQR